MSKKGSEGKKVSDKAPKGEPGKAIKDAKKAEGSKGKKK